MPARKRRTKYTWLPISGSAAQVEGDPQRANKRGVGIVSIDGAEDLEIIPLLLDTPAETANQDETLADIIGSEYFIKRIVGKLFCSYSQVPGSQGDIPVSVLVTAGFFIARADTALGQGVPVGTDDALNNYSPAAAINIREPWVWRRTWMLGNEALEALTVNSPTWPGRNTSYSGVMDGPHIDARTARRVRKEERLFFALSCGRAFSDAQEGTPDGPANVNWLLDYRVLGALRKSVARGSF